MSASIRGGQVHPRSRELERLLGTCPSFDDMFTTSALLVKEAERRASMDQTHCESGEMFNYIEPHARSQAVSTAASPADLFQQLLEDTGQMNTLPSLSCIEAP